MPSHILVIGIALFVAYGNASPFQSLGRQEDSGSWSGTYSGSLSARQDSGYDSGSLSVSVSGSLSDSDSGSWSGADSASLSSRQALWATPSLLEFEEDRWGQTADFSVF